PSPAGGAGSLAVAPLRGKEAASAGVSAPEASAPGTTAARGATGRGTRQGTPVFAERTAAPMLPPAGRTLPSRPNSPTATASTCPVTTPEAASTPRAIGRSKSVPDLGRSAGARFTVTLRLGKWRPVELIAARTRSFASRTALSGSPLSRYDSFSVPTWTCTSTGRASPPTRATELVAAFIRPNVWGVVVGWKGFDPVSSGPARWVGASPGTKPHPPGRPRCRG